MSDSSRKHWKDDSSQYTFNQYVVYLVLLALLMAAMIGWFIWVMRPVDVPRTNLIIVASQSGGDRPVIPFQESDVEVLLERVEGSSRFDFDDAPDFDSAIAGAMLRDYEQMTEAETALVWLSGVGTVVDGKPAIMTSKANQSIPFDRVVETFLKLKAGKIILMLDCGHLVPDRGAYQNTNAANDFNQFAQLIREYSFDGDRSRIALLLTSNLGQQPLYSTGRRRSLFGMALEETLETEGLDLQSLVSTLNSKMADLGGRAAAECYLSANSEFGNPELPKLNLIEPKNEEERKETDPFFEPVVLTVKNDATMDLLWAEYVDAWNAIANTSPATYNGGRWDSITQRMAKLTYSNLRGSGTLDELSLLRSDILNFRQQAVDQAKKDLERYRLAGTEEEPLSEEEEVFQTVNRFYTTSFRIKHYAALYDSLSWIMPRNNTLLSFRNELQLLSKVCSENLDLLTTRTPSADQLPEYRQAYDDIRVREQRLNQILRSLANREMESLFGMEREVAVDNLLRFPFWTKPLESSEDSTSPGELPTRSEIRSVLKSNRRGEQRQRITDAERLAAALERLGLYRQLAKQFASQNEVRDDLRMLQAFAYRLQSPVIDIASVVVSSRTINTQIVFGNKGRLESEDGVIIEKGANASEATEIDLGLSIVGNAQLVTECELIQDGSAFELAGAAGDRVTCQNAIGKFKIWATRTNKDGGGAARLRVKIYDQANPNNREEIAIRLKLPNPNIVQLIADPNTVPVLFDSETPRPIRAFANRTEFCTFKLNNQWHKERTVSVSLYACPPDQGTIPGKITETVKRLAIRDLQRGTLGLIASTEVAIPARQTDENEVPLIWKPKALAEGEVAPTPIEGEIPLTNGMLCVIEDAQNSTRFQYWLETFPVKDPVVELFSEVRNNDLYFTLERNRLSPTAAVKVSWEFLGLNDTDNLPNAKTLTASEEVVGPFVVLENINQKLKIGDYVFVDVDGWPRRLVYRYTGTSLEEPADMMYAEFDMRASSDKLNSPDRKLEPHPEIASASDQYDKVFGTRQPVESIALDMQVSLPINLGQFSFNNFDPDKNCLYLKGTSGERRYFYPWNLETKVKLNTKSGLLGVTSSVANHRVTFPTAGLKFLAVRPEAKISGREAQALKGPNRIAAYFDNERPKITNVTINTQNPTLPGKEISVSVTASDDGIGLKPNRELEFFFSTQPMVELPPKKFAIPAKPNENDEYILPARYLDPGVEEQTFYLGILATDLVGNTDTYVDAATSITVKKEVKPKVEMEKAAPLNHRIVVTTSNRFGTRFKKAPKVTIEPKLELESRSRLGSGDFQYVFSGAEDGKRYEVSGVIELGPDQGGGTMSGRTTVKVPKDQIKTRRFNATLNMSRD